MKVQAPENIIKVIKKLKTSGFEGFVVGGSVRDLLLGITPKDWDVTTNAKPKELLEIFPDSVYENDFGTVGVKLRNKEDETCEVVEITTYRIESKYTDKRHPDEVKFAKTLEEDLSRRDFTVNAMALKIPNKLQNSNFKIEIKKENLIDPFNGQEGLKNKTIQAVGDASERFNEDALRMMRAVRFVCQLSKSLDPDSSRSASQNKTGGKVETTKQGWKIEEKTLEALEKNVDNLEYISKERIRDELNKIILSDSPAQGIDLLVQTKLMKYIIPEIGKTIGVRQNHHHYHGPYNTVYAHMLASLEKCLSKKLEIRLASFLHDLGKPQSKRGEGETATFHGHEYISARLVERILKRLKYSRKIIDKVVMLVKNHMFYYNVDEVGESGVRKVVRKVGLENINDLIDVRIADRLGSGVPKAVPYKLRHFKYMVEKVSHDAISVKQLKINGKDLMEDLNIKPGPKIGAILEVLLARVIDEPKLNTKKELIKLAKELEKEDLGSLREMAKEKIKEEQKKEDEGIKGKYWVK